MTAHQAIIHIGIDPVVHIGGLAIHWYGVCYAVAFWAAWRYAASPYLTSRGVSQAVIDRILFAAIVVGLIGARLYYDVQNTGLIHNPIDVIAVWNGGMDFFGAILAVFTAMVLLARRHRVSYWLLIDAAALFAVLGQPIGRIGNIINGDILGSQSSLPWATAYTNPNAVLQPGFHLCDPNGVCPAYQPAAVYEIIGTLLIGLLLIVLLRRGVRPGVLGITFVAAYAASHMVIFALRESEPAVLWGLKQSQWTSIGLLVVAVPLLVVLWRRFPPADKRSPVDAPREVVVAG
ncbi:MAG TPA: prolipoprotein diacylglyceryl transferase [Candidatus Dormibacteraeota bacterium]